MKKRVYHALSVLLAAAMLLAAVPLAGAAAKEKTLYSWTATTLEKDRKVFSSNLVVGTEGEVRWNESGTMYTAEGKKTVTAHCFINEVVGFGDQLCGLPYTISGNKTIAKPLRLETYPAVDTQGMGAVNVSFLYAYQPDQNGNNVANSDLMRIYVSENGLDWSADSVGLRTAQIVGCGTTKEGNAVIYYRVQSEDLLKINGLERGELIQGIRIVPDSDAAGSKGTFALCELTVTGYESADVFRTAVPVNTGLQNTAIKLDEEVCRQLLLEGAARSDAATEFGMLRDAVALMTRDFPEFTADLLDSSSVRLVDGVATKAAERVLMLFEWFHERDLMSDELRDSLVADHETITTTANIVRDLNTPQQIFRAYAKVKPGDMLLQVTESKSNVYLVTANNAVMLKDRVNVDIANSTMTYRTVKGEVTKTYFDLFAKDVFAPMTLTVLADGKIGAATVDVFASAADTVCVAVASDQAISGCEIAVGDAKVTVDWPGATGLVCTDKALTDAVAKLPDGKHEMTVTVASGLGEPVEAKLELQVKDGKATVLTSTPDHAASCPSKAMTDVDKNAWYHEAVDYALANGIMGGYNATTFGPNDTLSRAMVVQVLYNKEGQPAISGKHAFTDVPADQWFNNAVTWGTQNGVMGGYGDGKFGPNDSVTIEQIAVILWNYSGNPAFTGKADGVGTYSGWAANALAWAVENDILAGVPFSNATENATRAQTAQMLMNYLKNN